MRVKHRQLYNNDCGINAIYNLLELYGIKNIRIKIDYSIDGTSIENVEKVLKKFFYKVKTVTFDMNELKNVKSFMPFICLLKKNNVGHYVVIYKKDKKYLYICDSLAKKSYKMKYEELNKLECINIIVEKPIVYKKRLLNDMPSILVPIIEIFESLLVMSTAILVQQIIDNGSKDAILYILVQLLLLSIGTFRAVMFLKLFKRLDKDLIIVTHNAIFNKNIDYYKNHERKEVFYRINDAYNYKEMILSFIFDMIGDISMAIFAFIFIFLYSYKLGFVILGICSILFILSYFIFKKSKEIVERKRIKEYDFIDYYKGCIDNYDNIYQDKKYENNSRHYLKVLQRSDYDANKLHIVKGMILVYFQSIITIVVVVLYFTNLFSILSIGSLIAMLNLVSLVLNPILNICSSLTNFSNRKEIKNRLDEIAIIDCD